MMAAPSKLTAGLVKPLCLFMIPKRRGSMRPVAAEVSYRRQGEPFIYRMMQLSSVRNIPDCAMPIKWRSANTNHTLVMHHAVAGGLKPQEIGINDDTPRLWTFLCNEFDHPL